MKKIIQQFVILALTLLISLPFFGHDLKSIDKNYNLVVTPTITSFSPTSGLIGTTVTVLGTNFSSVPSENNVQFNGLTALVTAASATSLTVIVPIATTTGAITVSVAGFSIISSSVYTVLTNANCNGISKNNAKHWYFGNQAAMKFENNIPVALTNSAMTQVEGVATMTDSNGNLLFYTNGITIFNKNHQTMVNGTGLTSNSSNTQAAFIVPFPENPNKYYVITPGPYNYSIVDMTLDNGNGAVMATAKNISITTENSEKVAGLLAANQTDIWLITYGNSLSRFNVYKITPTGITTTPIISQFAIASGFFGYMKISPDGTKIAMANFNESFHLYDFDVVTGLVTNQVVVPISVGGFGSYGIEFSPNSNLIYVSDHRGANKVNQYSITLATPALISSSVVALAANLQALGGIQLGPDNKIYVAKENSPFLGVINNPDVLGAGCTYILDGVNLSGKTSNLGLPGFVASSLVENQPYLTSFLPISGEIGQTVTITGSDFSAIIANNSVSFNGVIATVLAATSTSLTVLVPVGATTGTISIESGCNLVASTNDFTISNLNVNAFLNNKLNIYPNPSNGMLHFDIDRILEDANLQIVDISGRIVFTNSNFNSNETINISFLKSGIYIVKVNHEGKTFSQKIIKQ
jgi:hypothetical protein